MRLQNRRRVDVAPTLREGSARRAAVAAVDWALGGVRFCAPVDRQKRLVAVRWLDHRFFELFTALLRPTSRRPVRQFHRDGP